jgi:HK97 family phage prohead protease
MAVNLLTRASDDAEVLPSADGKLRRRYVVSTDSLDSHETILQGPWRLDRYRANPVVLWAHQSRTVPVGTVERIDERRSELGKLELVADVVFRDAGKSAVVDEVRAAVEDGSLRGTSVGFRAHSYHWEKHSDVEVLVLRDLELLEISMTPVPSNADALESARAGDGYRTLDEIVTSLRSTERRIQAPAGATGDHMSLAIFARALGMPDNAPESDVTLRATQLVALVAACGAASVEEARGAIAAGRAAVEALPKLEARIAELETEQQQRERDAIIAELRAEGRISPALEQSFVPALSLEALRSYAKVAPRVIPGVPAKEPTSGVAAGVRHNGKTFDELSATEPATLARLYESEPETYRALKADAERRPA